MNTTAVRIRWLNDACYELVLPNGKHILVDPYVDESKFRILSYQDIDQVD